MDKLGLLVFQSSPLPGARIFSSMKLFLGALIASQLLEELIAENFTLPSLEHLAGCSNEAQGTGSSAARHSCISRLCHLPTLCWRGQLEIRSSPLHSKGQSIWEEVEGAASP